MKSSSKLGDISQKLQGHLWTVAVMAFTVARSPQLYLDWAWDASRKYLFSVIFVSLVVSKCFHIFVHLNSLGVLSLLLWGPTFFLVDIVLILVACRLARSFTSRIARDIAAVVTLLFSFGISSMTSANISFYVHLGVEIHWGKSKRFHQDVPSFLFVISALTVAILADALIWTIAYFLTPYLFRATDAFLDIWASVLPAKLRCSRRERSPLPDPEVYEQVAFEDYDDNENDDDSVAMLDTVQEAPRERTWPFFMRAIVVACSSILLFFSLVRPRDITYSFLSESLPFIRFYGPGHFGFDDGIAALSGDFGWLGNHTALDTFPEFDWLEHSEDGPSPWSPLHENTFNMSMHKSFGKFWEEHYNPLKDPLHIPNLGNDILDSVREAIHSGDVKIKHIIIVKLESTRQDVWPFRTSSFIMDNHIKDSYSGSIPKEVMARLSNLTYTAERLTGFKTGFENSDRPKPKPYGGISASNAYTSGTYTMKSITGTVCGLSPMACEKNLEYYHDFYQPCLPHIFEALNKQPGITSDTDDWSLWPWHTSWIQVHYGTWDRQERLLPALGYSDILTKESINATGNKYIPEENEREYHYGHEDKLANNYMRDLFADAKKNNTRVFLTHLTHNTHTPWFIPGDYESYMELIGGADHGLRQKINGYLNTIHYQDEWINDILQILEDEEIADETLLVMAGDHGISLPNDGGITANHDPHVGNFHVPLFFSHPKIPQIEVSDPVVSTQILPTLLDLLIETASMDEPSTKILKDLLPLYEGQSMIRPLISSQNDKQEWHFSTMNPGGTWISMRAAPDPYRLVVPLVPEAPWRFSNVVEDPFELHVEEDYDIVDLIDVVQTRHGPEAAKWLNKAAHVAQWWIKDNHRRWGYDPEAEKEDS